MCGRLLGAIFFVGLLQHIACAGGVSAVPFIDGRWYGGTKGDLNNSIFEECWATTKFDDGTTFTLSKRRDGIWTLQLSNPGWRLPIARRYAMSALVDFYPRLQITAKARSQTLLEIADLDRSSLLGLIENGHTIDLASDGFNQKYELEGSAKIIERIRDCFAGIDKN